MEVKPGYKQTEVGLIPEEWEVASIGTIASFKSGDGINVAALHEQSSDTPIPVYGGNGIAGYAARALVQEPVVVVGRVGQKCGEVYITGGPAWITDNALYPRAFFRKTDVRFLALALKGAGLNGVKNRNDLPLITQSILHSVRIPLPPTKAEQEAIAGPLCDADALIKSLEQLLVKKRQFKQGAMQEFLTGKKRLPGFSGDWRVTRLGELAEMGSGGTPPSTNQAFYNGDIPWVSISDMTKCGKFISTTDRSLSTTGLNNSAAQMFSAGTVLYAMYASLGECSIAGIPLCSSQAILGIKVKSSLDNEFLYYFLTSIRAQVRTMGQQGTQANLNKGMVQGFQLRLPPRPEQLAIAAILSDIDEEIAALDAKLAKARQLKQGMTQELLTGRIRLV